MLTKTTQVSPLLLTDPRSVVDAVLLAGPDELAGLDEPADADELVGLPGLLELVDPDDPHPATSITAIATTTVRHVISDCRPHTCPLQPVRPSYLNAG